MINSKLSNNGMANSGTGLSTYHKPVAIKKVALRDVQNDNGNIIHQHLESSNLSGTKRLTPECPPDSPHHQFLSSTCAKDNSMHDYRKFESELGKRKIQDAGDKSTHNFQSRLAKEIAQQKIQIRESKPSNLPAFAPMPMPSLMTLSSRGPSIPSSLAKPTVPNLVDSKVVDEQKRRDRFLRLQQLLKQRDESNQQEYIQMLLGLAPSELSRYAVELEKRSIQLTFDEGKEIQRMKVLNILGKSEVTTNLSLATQRVHPKK